LDAPAVTDALTTSGRIRASAPPEQRASGGQGTVFRFATDNGYRGFAPMRLIESINRQFIIEIVDAVQNPNKHPILYNAGS